MAREVLLTFVLTLGAVGCGKTGLNPGDVVAMGGASAAGSGQAGVVGAGAAGALQGGSAASSADDTTLSEAVEECKRLCETAGFDLPTALCGGWDRPGWRPEYCRLTDRYTCSDCVALYATVSPECAATLPRVSRCLAPLYENVPLFQGVGVPLPAGVCWLEGCHEPLFTMASACFGVRQQLDAARASWKASGITDYQLRYAGLAGETHEVQVRGALALAVTPADSSPWTVPELFDEVERLLDTPGVAPAAVYDAQLGYVTHLTRDDGCSEAVLVSGVELTRLP